MLCCLYLSKPHANPRPHNKPLFYRGIFKTRFIIPKKLRENFVSSVKYNTGYFGERIIFPPNKKQRGSDLPLA